MIHLTLDSKPLSLELPPDCFSVAAAVGHVKRKLGAAWADIRAPVSAIAHFKGPHLSDDDLMGVIEEGYGKRGKKRLFLSAKGWQPGGALPEDASLLAYWTGSTKAAICATADELPACLLRGGVLQLQAFTAKQSKVTVDLPTGRTIQLPVSEATRNAHVSAYVSALLGCTPDSVRLWHAVDGSLCMAGDASTAMPCTRFSVTQSNAADPGPLELCVKTLWGKNLQVCLLPSNTVNELKQTICDQEDLPVEKQRLIFSRCQLEDNRTLASCQIRTGDTLHLALRGMRGGMFAYSSGRAGDFAELGLAADEAEVAAVAAAGKIPLEVVLPDGGTVLLSCPSFYNPSLILRDLRTCLSAAAAEAALLAADVDSMQDVAAMREMLRQAQAALRGRQP